MNKNKKTSKLLFLALIISIVFVGCTQTEKKVEEKITVTDMLKRNVEVPKDVKRIVCIGPGALRLIVYLDATDKVVGVEDAEKSGVHMEDHTE